MKKTYFVSLAVLSLFAGVSCQREEIPQQDPMEGKEELVLKLAEPSSLRFETRSYTSEEGDLVFSVETQDIEFGSDSASTRAITSVSSIGNGNVVWGARVGTNPVSFWNPVRVAASNNEVHTGRYVGTSGGTTNTYYLCNSPSASNLSVTASGATLAVGNTSPSSGTDIVVGKATSSGHEVDIQLDHIYARIGDVTLSVPQGLTVTNLTWYILSHDNTTGYRGTYDIESGSWTSSGMLNSTRLYDSNDLYVIPGLYDIELSYRVSPTGGTSQSVTRTGTVSLAKGKVNNLSASVPDIVTYDLFVAWASSTGVGGTYQEVPAHGDIYVGGHGTLEARLYTLRNGIRESYIVVPNSQVTWSIPYDSYYLSIDGTTGELTGLSANNYSADYGNTSCYVRASATVDGVTYNATGANKEGRVNIVADEVSSYGNPTLQLVYDPNPIVAEGGVSVPTLTYSQVVTYVSGRTETITGTITSGATWSGSASGFSLNTSNGRVTADDNINIPSYTYGTPQVTLSYTGTPIAAAGGDATPVLSFSQSVRERRTASSQRSITVSVSASVNGKTGTASCVVNQSGAPAIDETTYETEGGQISYEFVGASTGFSINSGSGLVSAAANVGSTSVSYADPVVSLSYNPNSFSADGGTAVPTLGYSQVKTTSVASTSTRSVTVRVSVSRHGLTGTQTATVSQSGQTGSSQNETLTSGGSVSWSMDTATGFTLNTGNGNVVVAQNNTASARSTHAWATVSMNGRSASSSHVLISQEAGTVTTYEYELLLVPATARLEVGYSRTYTATLRTYTVVNGVRTGTYSDTVLSNSSLTWSITGSAATMSSGTVTAVNAGSTGSTTVTVTALYTPAGYSQLSATAQLTVISGGGSWDDDWNPGGTIILD